MMNERKLFIHETIDNVKRFWLMNPHSNFFELQCQIIGKMSLDSGFQNDQKFADDLEFELEQADAE